MASVLIVGCGKIGQPVALALHGQGHAVTVIKRTPPVQQLPFPVFAADIGNSGAIKGLPTAFDAVLFIVSPGRRDLNAYRHLYQLGIANLLDYFARAERNPRWLLVSSTSVYGQRQGEWVGENSVTEPALDTGGILLAAEQTLWLQHAGHCVVRFGGIYGSDGGALLRRVAAGEPVQQLPPYYTNRIHRDDCAAVLLFLLQKLITGDKLEFCYLACDDEPAPLWDVANWLAVEYAYTAPKALQLPLASDQNKRCSNARLKALGFRFAYPDYRAGYRRRQHKA